MPVLRNDIVINAPLETIWDALADLNNLENLDPLAATSKAITPATSGLGSKRKVHMKDGKNWFEEECSEFVPHEKLKFELQACSFPVHNLYHSYRFEQVGTNTYRVKQEQAYTMKYGIFGSLIGAMIKSKWNKGVQGFLGGLKSYSEQQQHQ